MWRKVFTILCIGCMLGHLQYVNATQGSLRVAIVVKDTGILAPTMPVSYLKSVASPSPAVDPTQLLVKIGLGFVFNAYNSIGGLPVGVNGDSVYFNITVYNAANISAPTLAAQLATGADIIYPNYHPYNGVLSQVYYSLACEPAS